MVTPEELKEYLQNQYQIDDDDSLFSIVVQTNESRTQVVIVQIIDVKGQPFCRILSRIGNLDTYGINKALSIMTDKLMGGLVKIDEMTYVIHGFSLNSLDTPNDINLMIEIIAYAADDIEKEILSVDNN